MGKKELTGLINFKRVDKVAVACVSGAEVPTILITYLSSGNNLEITLAVTATLIPSMVLFAKGIEISNRVAARFHI